MKVIIPMAGLGTRMRPHTYSEPKPLVNVAGEPMLKYLIDSLQELDVDEYIFIIGYLGDQIKEWVSEHYDFKATYVVQEELIGQAHAIYLAREHLEGPAIILFSDTLYEADVSVINRTEADAIAFVKEVDDPRRFGVVSLNEDGQITRFVEKPDTKENKNAVIGLYWLRDAAHMIRAIETQMARNQMTKGEFYIADAFQIMIEEGAAFRTQNVDVWLDCGKPETVLETNRWLLEHRRDNSADAARQGVAIIPPVYIDPTATVERSVIGPYATISAGSTVRSSIIENTIVDRDAEVDGANLSASLVGKRGHVSQQAAELNIGATSTIDL